jgi:predicted site-specific integrase-resolvase
MNPQELVERFGNKRQAALHLGISRQTLYAWLRKGCIPAESLKKVQRRLKRLIPA